MPKKYLEKQAFYRMDFTLKIPGPAGLRELELCLSALKKSGEIKDARFHVGFTGNGKGFAINFVRRTDALKAKLHWRA
jgi:hypothetical protein